MSAVRLRWGYSFKTAWLSANTDFLSESNKHTLIVVSGS